MNKKWIGDDHDLRKFTLLQLLCRELRIGVFINWMQTEEREPIFQNDVAKKISVYTSEYDRRSLVSFGEFIKKSLINDCFCFFESVTDRKKWRDDFIKAFNEQQNNSFVFFDPYTGIEPPKSEANEAHIKLLDIQQTINKTNAEYILIYQHDNKREKDYIKTKLNQLLPYLRGEKRQFKIGSVFTGYEKGKIQEYYILICDSSKMINKLHLPECLRQSFFSC